MYICIYIYIDFFAWVWTCLNTCSAHEVQEIMDFELGSPCHGNQKWEGQLRCCGACTSLQLLVVFKIWPWDDDGWWSTLPLKQLFNCSLRVKTYANRQSGGLDSMGLWWFMAVTCKSPPTVPCTASHFVAQLPTTSTPPQHFMSQMHWTNMESTHIRLSLC